VLLVPLIDELPLLSMPLDAPVPDVPLVAPAG
jgi:hypothetical protein